MKRFFLIPFLLLAFNTWLLGQVSEYIPKEYNDQFNQVRDRIKPNDDRIWLDPIEQVPIIPTEFSIQNGGNWGFDFYQVDQYQDRIARKAARPVAVFIFDTGATWDHSALQAAAWPEKSRVFDGEAPLDANGHSTHVAGIVGGVSSGTNLGIGAILVRNNLLKLIGYKVLSKEGFGFTSDIVRGIRTANEEAKDLMAQGYFVIYNFSLGSQSVNSSFNTYLKQAEDLGVLVFGASGNNGTELIGTPANGTSTHAVASIDPDGSRSSYSNYGPQQYIGAPGSRVFSTWLNNQYRELSGTSMASPQMAGVSALVASMYPEATNRQISHFLRRHTKDLMEDGWDKFTGYGATPVSYWFNFDPTLEADLDNGNPDTPNHDPDPEPDPDPEEPDRKNRRITYRLKYDFEVQWKTITGNEYQKAWINLCISYNSRLDAPAAAIFLKDEIEAFYESTGILVSDGSDVYDAGFWARHFLEKGMRENDIDIEVKYASLNDGNQMDVEIGQRNSLSTGLIKLFNPEIRMVSIKK